MRPLISVIIPVFHVERYVEECLRSVQRQTYPHFEAILIDDGSTDGSAAICERFCAGDQRFRLYRFENEGLSEARNRGTRMAKGEYLTYVDADDWIAPPYLEKLRGLCARYGCLCSGCNHYIVSGQREAPRFSIRERHEFLALERCLENILYHRPPDVSACGKLYHRSMIPALTFPKGRLFEDTATIVTRLRAAEGMAMTYEPLYFYRRNARSISKSDYTSRSWELMDAVEEISKQILSAYPRLKRGTIRRKTHAALSIRRLLVRCGEENGAARERAKRIVRENALSVIADRKAPPRDKAAIALLLMGNAAFDFAWIQYQKRRESL